jgi:hypothetical protein
VTLPDKKLGIVVVSTTSSPLVPVSKTLAEGVTAELLGRPTPSLSEPLALSTLALLALTSALFAFSVARTRSLTGAQPATGHLQFIRILTLDVALPASILVGLPLLFSRALDRAETLSTVGFWRLVIRGVPDAGTLIVVALLLRITAGTYRIVRASLGRANTRGRAGLSDSVRHEEPEDLRRTQSGARARGLNTL